MHSVCRNHEVIHFYVESLACLFVKYDSPKIEHQFVCFWIWISYFFSFLFDFFRCYICCKSVVIIIINWMVEFRLIRCIIFILKQTRNRTMRIFWTNFTFGFCRALVSIFDQAESRSRSLSFSFCFSILYFCEHSSKSLWFISINNFNAL